MSEPAPRLPTQLSDRSYPGGGWGSEQGGAFLQNRARPGHTVSRQAALCWLPHSVALGTWGLVDTCPAFPPTLDSGPSLSLAGVSGLLLPKSEGWGSHSGGEPREPAGGPPAGAGNSFLSARVWPGPLLAGTRLPPEEAWRWALAEPRG